MLAALRNSLNSWIVKGLFVLLIASFAVWGIGDIFRSRALDQAAATVGSSRITLAEAQEAYRRELAQLTRSLGPSFEPNDTIRRSVAETAVFRLASSRAVEAEAARLGLTVPEAALRETIFAIPAFQGPNGQFSRSTFDNFLRQNGLTEPRLLQGLTADLMRAQLLGSAVSGATPPAALVDLVLAFREEARIGSYALLQTFDVAPPAPPADAELRRYHELNPNAFTSPERRTLQVATLTLDAVARDIPIADADLAAAYEARRSEFVTAPARELEQFLLQDETAATALADALRAGTQAAEAAPPGADRIELGFTARDELPFPALADAVWTATLPGVAGPVRSPFGWHVVLVKAERPGETRSLAEVEPTLRASLARDRASERIYERLNRIEDDLSASRPLSAIAERHGMELATFGPLDRDGRSPAGQPVPLGPNASRILEAGFSETQGPSRPIEAEDGSILLVAVERTEPPALLPYETVEPQVLAAWQATERRRTQEERAARILAAAGAGPDGFETALRAENLVPRQTPPLTRTARAPAEAGADFLPRLFSLKPGETTMLEVPQGFVVLNLASVVPADPAAAAEAQTRIRAQLQQAMAGELETLLVQAIQSREGVSLNPTMLDDIARR